MLAIKTTEKLTGVTVSGTYGELNALYDAMEDAVFGFAKEEGVPYYEIELNGMEYPDEIEW